MNSVEPIFDDSTPGDLLFPAQFGRGYEPRNFATHPLSMFAPPSGLALIPRSEWSARIKEQEATKSRLSDVRNAADNGKPFVNLDQGQVGYCWAHSTVHCVMVSRAVNNQPFVPLSAYAVAAIIKRGRDEGGWCGLSAQFCRENGVPAQKYWPQGDRSLSNDTPEMRANAALHKVTEDWVDLARPVHSQNLTFDQVATCLLAGVPCAVDFDWWGHSVCALDLVEPEPGSFGLRILNSWKNWGDNGTGILKGSKAIPVGAIAVAATGVSPD